MREALLALIMTIALGSAAAAAAPMPLPTTLLGRMGELMTQGAARHAIAFAPFTPPRRITAVAVLPPFHGDDVRSNRGIGFEYLDAANHRYMLAQWPRNGGTIERFPPYVTGDVACTGARMFRRGRTPNGIVWTTPRGIVVTLQADGANDARTLEAEWKKLIRRGVCR